MLQKQASQIIRKIRQDYNTMATDWNKTRYSPSGIKSRQLKGLKKGMTTLDLGCGNGLIATQVVSAGSLYTGVDISKKLIEIAKKKFSTEVREGKTNFLVADATRGLPFADSFFDRIFCFAVLHHIPSDELRINFLSEVHRVLKTGGEASFIVWNLRNAWPYKRFKIEEQLRNPKIGFEQGDVFVPWKATENKMIDRYLYVFTPDQLKELAKKVGFRHITIDYYNRAGVKVENGEELVLRVKK